MSDNPSEQLSPTKRALLEIRKLRAQLEAVEQARNEPIAIIGIGCRFPGEANDPDTFWHNLKHGVDGITDIPAERWDVDAYFDTDPNAAGKMYVRRGGFLRQVEQFDAQFFGITPREAKGMDPQQRLLLEVSWEALERAGFAPDSLVGSQTGVFVGIMLNDYAQRYLHQHSQTAVDAYYATGTDISFAAGRLSYILGLQGPSMALNTVCSSSLVAVHLACQSLRSGESNLALAGGVNVITSPEMFISLSRMGALAPDGRSKTFDAAADGYGRSEGCGMVVLKRLSDAQANGDPILALIRGSAVNHDGPSGALTVPNGPAQQALIRRALANAQVAPHEIDYVEAHGSGTPLGDPIEVKALNAVMSNGRSSDRPLMIGSVKTNIGHLESGAGVAGLIKVVLSLQHQAVPPQLHLQEINPAIGLEEMPVTIPQTLTPWLANGRPRRAGVSSFGLSGINAHLVIEEAPALEKVATATERPLQLLTLSAKSEAALKEQATHFARYLSARPDAAFADVCHTLASARSHFEQRLSLVAATADEAAQQLDWLVQGETVKGACWQQVDPERGLIAFLFPGQGGQYVQMGRELYETEPVFREVMDECAKLVAPYLERPLLSVIYPTDGEPSPLDEMMYAQPAMFTIEFALARLWQSWGIQPDLLLGHSLGEYVAACLAGVFTLADALKLVATRGRLMQKETEPGWMVVVFADESEVQAAIAPYQEEVGIAAINGEREITISGGAAAVAAAVAALEADGVRTRRLNIPYASHSPLMASILEPFRQTVTEVPLLPPQIDLVSNVSGRLAGAELTTVDYWVNHLRQPVRFAASVASLKQQGAGLYIEVGPRPALLGSGQQVAGSGVWLPSLRPKRDIRPFGTGEREQMLTTLGTLYTLGVSVDWAAFACPDAPQRVALPTYPFQRQRYWLEKQPGGFTAIAEAALTTAPMPEWLYELEWQEQPCADEPVEFAQNGRWLILADAAGVGAALAERLRAEGQQCTLAWPDAALCQRATDIYLDPTRPEQFRGLLATSDEPVRCVVHLWGAVPSPSLELNALPEHQRLGSESVLHLVQAMDNLPSSDPMRLWLVTRATQPVVNTAVQVAQSPLWGLGRVIALEHPDRWGGLIDLSPLVDVAADAAAILVELGRDDGENQIAFRNGRRYAPRLLPAAPSAPANPHKIKADATYLITGGLGVLGLEVAQWLVAEGARHLVLTSRSGLPAANSDLSAAQMQQVQAVQRLREQTVQILMPQADVADFAQMENVLAELPQDWPPLRGIIHAAGTGSSQPLRDMPLSALQSVLRAKVTGTWVLHQLAQKTAVSLDFFVLFSSGASVWGSQGLGHYAAANHFLDAVAHYRRAQGLPALSVNWGRWDGDGLVTDELAYFFAQIGLHEMPKAQALATLGYLLNVGAVQQAVAAVDWHRFKPIYEARGRQPLLAHIGAEVEPALVPNKRPIFAMKLEAAAPSARRSLLQAHVCRTVASVMGLDSPQTINLDKGFFTMGMDSIMTVELRNRLESALATSLLPTIAFEYPTVNELTSYLAAEVLHLAGEECEVPAEPPLIDTDGETAVSLRDELDALSEEAFMALVNAELAIVGEMVEED